MLGPRNAAALRGKVLIDLVLWTVATPLAFLLRFDGVIPESSVPALIALTGVGLVLKPVTYLRFRLYTQMWSKISFYELKKLVKAVGTVVVIEVPIVLILSAVMFTPRSVVAIDGALSLLLLITVRAVWRYRYEWSKPQPGEVQKRVLVVGAGEAGDLVVREMLRHADMGLIPVGFVDDDPAKHGLTLNGLPVLGGIDAIPEVLPLHRIDRVFIAAPSAEGSFIQRVVGLLSSFSGEVDYRVMRGVYEQLSGDASQAHTQDVRIEDLLRRPPVRLDLSRIGRYLDGETVLVTGAGGSIGSEIARQLCRFRPHTLVLLGRGENSIHGIEHELRAEKHDIVIETVIADIRDRNRVRQVFAEFLPTVVFHAAAHKHVSFMERYPEEAVLNNIVGTRNLAELALASGVSRFVNVSTDKAVNPTSVMGSSKRVAEGVVRLVATLARPEQHFVSVRFGNVLGTRGSVVPIFLRQIERGRPITITDPGMTRYFMTVSEAAQLVLQAGALSENGAVYISDMGEPVKITDLAEDLIRLSGLEPHLDIPITFTGIQPGEKLSEELMTESEIASATSHERIYVAHNEVLRPDQLRASVAVLERAAQRGDRKVIREELGRTFSEAWRV